MARLADAGSHVTSALSAGSDQSIALDDQVAIASEVLSQLRAWLDEASTQASKSDQEHQGWEYLLRTGAYLVDQSAKAFESAAKSRSGGFGLFGRGPNRWLALAETLRLEVSAASVLAVLRAYLNVDSAESLGVTTSPMYEVLISELSTISRQLDSMKLNPGSSQASVVAPFFQGLTESLQTLQSVLDERIADAGQLTSLAQQAGSRYLLACGTYTWQEANDSLGMVRQLYMDVRDRWASNSDVVLEKVGVTFLHCITGQAIVIGADSFVQSDALQTFSNPEAS
jgi:hypothetical protein